MNPSLNYPRKQQSLDVVVAKFSIAMPLSQTHETTGQKKKSYSFPNHWSHSHASDDLMETVSKEAIKDTIFVAVKLYYPCTLMISPIAKARFAVLWSYHKLKPISMVGLWLI